jgi:phosphoserine phosphatase RsbU/P
MSAEARRKAAEPDVDQLRRLTGIGRALTYATSLEQTARVTVEQGAALLDAAAAVLMLADADDLLHVRAAHGVEEARLARFRAPLGDELLERLQGLLGVPDDHFLAVPLVVGGAVTGLLAVALFEAPTAPEEWLLSALADQAAVALEHARLGGEVRVEMEERLRASVGSSSAKERALATLAHDIRSPLGAIDGYCANLEDALYGPVTDEQRAALGRVRMSGRHLLSLLDSVMDMARLDAGDVPLALEIVRCMEVAREAVEMLTPAAFAKGQKLQLCGERQVTVFGNHARMRQVLVNLLGNAVKFTPDGGTITITVAAYVAEGMDWGEIRVADTGPGIAESERAAIFEPYYRSESTAILPGVGLGLAISKTLVRQMGGELAVESELGVGSTFSMRMPARPAAAALPDRS